MTATHDSTYWPSGTDAEQAIVVVGKGEADLLAVRLPGELVDGVGFKAVPVAIPSLSFDPEQLSLDCLAAECIPWLLFPPGVDSYTYAGEVGEALKGADRKFLAPLSILPEGWGIAELLEAVGDEPGDVASALRTLWLAAGPPDDALKLYLRDLRMRNLD